MTEELYKRIEALGQIHILEYFEMLSIEEQKRLLDQIEEIVFSFADKKEAMNKVHTYSPIKVLTMDEIKKRSIQLQARGIEALKRGKVGLVLLAGGQGSRLGFDLPKGMYDVGINKSLTLFQLLIYEIMEKVQLIGKWLYLFVMTNEQSHKYICEYFEKNSYFGYNKDFIVFFVQDTMPSIDFDGKILTTDKREICLLPDGNGNFYSALKKSKGYEIIKRERIEWLNVFSVDNPLQKIADPLFIGATIASECNCGAKVVKKEYVDEKLGVICEEDNVSKVIEYYEVSKVNNPEFAFDDRFIYGVTLNYLFNVLILDKIKVDDIPLHYASKNIRSASNKCGELSRKRVNGYKIEYLITDLVSLSKTCLPFEVSREKEFAPIKNKTGVDSVETARKLLISNGYEL